MMNFASLRLRPTRLGENTRSSPYPLEWISMILTSQKKEKARGTWLWLFYYITEKSILVMIDPRPTVVPGELGLLSLQS